MMISNSRVLQSISVATVLFIYGCGGGGTGVATVAPVTPSPTVLKSQMVDGPVAGLCYSTTSGLSGVTDSVGAFSYSSGDSVTFWIDASGNNCQGVGASSTAATSILIGVKEPTGAASFALTLDQGQQVADVLTALNNGTGSSLASMSVSSIKLNTTDVANLNTFISGGGTLPIASAGSIDAFFHTIQANATTPSGAVLAYVTPVANSASTTVSALELTVNAALAQTASNLGTIVGATNTPKLTIPASGSLLRFAISTNIYQQPLSSSPTTNFSNNSGNFQYFLDDGTGSGTGTLQRIDTVGQSPQVTVQNYYYSTGTYTGGGTSHTTLVLNKTNLNNGQPFTQTNTNTITYDDGFELLATGSYTKTYTSASTVNATQTFQTGTYSSTGRILTPISPTILSGHTIGLANGCTLAYSAIGSGTTVTQSKSCIAGGTFAPVTIATSPIPGVITMTDGTGWTAFRGLVGPLSAGHGSRFVTIEVDTGTGSGYSSVLPCCYNAVISSVQ